MTIFLDACSIIYWVEMAEPYYSRLTAYFQGIEQECGGAPAYSVSRISILECLVKPLREDDQVLVKRYGHFFASRNLKIVELSPTVIDCATQVRAFCSIKTPDAIQAASALSIKGPVRFVTNDKRFGLVPGLTVSLLPE
jgi:predicted nucleic acid-binding protein